MSDSRAATPDGGGWVSRKELAPAAPPRTPLFRKLDVGASANVGAEAAPAPNDDTLDESSVANCFWRAVSTCRISERLTLVRSSIARTSSNNPAADVNTAAAPSQRRD